MLTWDVHRTLGSLSITSVQYSLKIIYFNYLLHRYYFWGWNDSISYEHFGRYHSYFFFKIILTFDTWIPLVTVFGSLLSSNFHLLCECLRLWIEILSPVINAIKKYIHLCMSISYFETKFNSLRSLFTISYLNVYNHIRCK